MQSTQGIQFITSLCHRDQPTQNKSKYKKAYIFGSYILSSLAERNWNTELLEYSLMTMKFEECQNKAKDTDTFKIYKLTISKYELSWKKDFVKAIVKDWTASDDLIFKTPLVTRVCS